MICFSPDSLIFLEKSGSDININMISIVKRKGNAAKSPRDSTDAVSQYGGSGQNQEKGEKIYSFTGPDIIALQQKKEIIDGESIVNLLLLDDSMNLTILRANTEQKKLRLHRKIDVGQHKILTMKTTEDWKLSQQIFLSERVFFMAKNAYSTQNELTWKLELNLEGFLKLKKLE